MPDVLNVPKGPGKHRPHKDYEDTRTYCGECYEPWPCWAHVSYLGSNDAGRQPWPLINLARQRLDRFGDNQ